MIAYLAAILNSGVVRLAGEVPTSSVSSVALTNTRSMEHLLIVWRFVNGGGAERRLRVDLNGSITGDGGEKDNTTAYTSAFMVATSDEQATGLTVLHVPTAAEKTLMAETLEFSSPFAAANQSASRYTAIYDDTTSQITSVTISCVDSGGSAQADIDAGSTFQLYGLRIT